MKNNNIVNHPLHYSIYTRSCAEDIFGLMEVSEDLKLLDAGCGIGYYLERLMNSPVKPNLFGLEYDYDSLKYANERVSGNFVKADGASIPYKDDSFDIILTASVLEHFENDNDLVKELVRVCKNEGQFILSVPSKDGIRSFSKMRNLGHDDSTSPEYHFRIGYSKEELKSILNKYGVHVEEVRYSLIFSAEIFMDLVKWVYFKKNKLKSQSNIADSTNSQLFKIYKYFVPLVLFAESMEKRLLSKWLRGHIITVRGRVCKNHKAARYRNQMELPLQRAK